MVTNFLRGIQGKVEQVVQGDRTGNGFDRQDLGMGLASGSLDRLGKAGDVGPVFLDTAVGDNRAFALNAGDETLGFQVTQCLAAP